MEEEKPLIQTPKNTGLDVVYLCKRIVELDYQNGLLNMKITMLNKLIETLQQKITEFEKVK